MQVAVKQALRDWFEAARKGSEGVSGTEIVDAAITLGLNYDYKQVHQKSGRELKFQIPVFNKMGMPSPLLDRPPKGFGRTSRQA